MDRIDNDATAEEYREAVITLMLRRIDQLEEQMRRCPKDATQTFSIIKHSLDEAKYVFATCLPLLTEASNAARQRVFPAPQYRPERSDRAGA